MYTSWRALGRPMRAWGLLRFSAFSSWSSIVPVEVGATLKVDLAQAGGAVEVAAGQELEQIQFQVDSEAVSSLDIAASPKAVSVKGSPKSLRIVMPEKWCTLLLNAGHQDVHIQSISDADLKVQSDGGNVSLGRLRGNDACIRTRGGVFSAGMLSAACKVETVGGSMSVRKLVGTDISISTGGGGASVRSCYGEVITIDTMSGSVVLDYLKAATSALVASGGGNVNIKGLDGQATIVSSGGQIEVQLCDGAKEVKLDSGGGDVLVYVSAQLTVKVCLDLSIDITFFSSRAGKVDCLGTGKVHIESEGDDKATDWTEKSRRSTIEEASCRIEIRGPGNVVVRRRSWIESMKSRIAEQVDME